jgi:hypothetical protein
VCKLGALTCDQEPLKVKPRAIGSGNGLMDGSSSEHSSVECLVLHGSKTPTKMTKGFMKSEPWNDELG